MSRELNEWIIYIMSKMSCKINERSLNLKSSDSFI